VKTLLVFGARGFIGHHLVTHLAREHQVIAVASTSRVPLASVHAAEPANRITLIGIDGVTDAAIEAINLAAYGVHPGARDVAAMQHVNVDLAAAIVRVAARRRAAVVMAGSSAEYANPTITQTGLKVTALLENSRLYGASKAAGGLLALATATTLGVPMRLLRLFNVYGPGEAPHRLLPSMCAAHGSSRRIALSAGTQVRDFVHVTDAVGGITAAVRALVSGDQRGADVLNLCSGTGTTVRHFAEIAASAIGLDDHQLGFGEVGLRPDDVPWLVGDPSKMMTELGWYPTRNLANGIWSSVGMILDNRVNPNSI
jgi:nucleoside-diphosphate-sugar epimerase